MGNIPAYAGKTAKDPHGKAHKTEHPRVCGENALITNPNSKPPGTSPRMRGKRRGVLMVRVRVGNIPAYAGKTRMLPHQLLI